MFCTFHVRRFRLSWEVFFFFALLFRFLIRPPNFIFLDLSAGAAKPKPQISAAKPKAPPPLIGPKPRPKSAFTPDNRTGKFTDVILGFRSSQTSSALPLLLLLLPERSCFHSYFSLSISLLSIDWRAKYLSPFRFPFFCFSL